MSITAQFKHHFRLAAKAVQQDPTLQYRPDIRVERSVFEGVFAPIKAIINQNEMMRQFMSPNGVSLCDQIKELRKMCLEAQVSHTTSDPLLKQHRMQLINALQGIMESVQDMQSKNSQYVSVDFGDFFAMIDRLQEIRTAARIHGEFMGNKNVALAMGQVADNIKTAQANLWEPEARSSETTKIDA